MTEKEEVSMAFGQILQIITPFINKGIMTHFSIDFTLNGKTYTLALVEAGDIIAKINHP
jgi:hypothetical protein